MKKNNQTISKDNNYQTLLQDVQSLISKGKYKAYKAFDNILVQTNWQIGERVVREELKQKDRAGYGKVLIKNLAIDLNIKNRDLHNIIRFYRFYPIVCLVSTQLSWTHYRYLITIDEKRKRTFYQNKAILDCWSVKELIKQIKKELYENTPKKEIDTTFQTKLPAIKVNKVFKDVYNFNFIELQSGEGEKDIENKILNDAEAFLKELGSDFALIGRQVPIKIGGETHFIDLVLFHYGIPCFVLVDLKNREFNARDVGQINEYIGYYRLNKQYEYMHDTIGLIVCRDANREKVMYALDGMQEKIFVSEYKVRLPSEERIEKIIHGLNR